MLATAATSLLTLETAVQKESLRSVLVYGGFPLSAQHVLDGVVSQLEREPCLQS